MTTTTEKSWLTLVEEHDEDFNEPDKDVYKFSNGRGFESTDKTTSGVYEAP